MRYRAEQTNRGDWIVIDQKMDMLVTPSIQKGLARKVAEYLNRAYQAELYRAAESVP